MVFHELIQKPETGELFVKAVKEVGEYYKAVKKKGEAVLYHVKASENAGLNLESETLGAALYEVPGDRFAMEIEFEIVDAHEFGIALHVDVHMENGYFLRMNQEKMEVAWDMWPRAVQGKYQWQIKGDVPYQVETARRLPKGNHYHLLILREKDICVVYINDEVVLSTRLYDFKAGYGGLYLIQGKAVIHFCELRV